MTRILLLTCALFLPLLGQSDEILDPAAPFAWIRQSESASSKEGLGKIVVDPELFQHSEENFSDVRLFRIRDEEQLEWPFQIRETRPIKRKTPPRPINSEVLSFDKTNEEELVYIVSLPSKAPPVGSLTIHTPLRNFEKTVSVSGSPDGENWESLVSEFLIYDREVFLDFRRTKVNLPANNHRQFRIQVRNASDEQQSALRNITRTLGEDSEKIIEESLSVTVRNFRVDHFTFHTPEKPSEPTRGEMSYPVTLVSQETGEGEKTSEVVLEVGTAPLYRLTVAVEDRNFRRNLRIEVPRKDKLMEWRTIDRKSIHRYEVAGLKEEDLTLDFSEISPERIRLVFENGDNRPLKIESAQGFGPLHEIVFLTEPGDQWMLAYEVPASTLSRPDYDIAVLKRAEEAGVPEEEILLSEQTSNPVYDETAGLNIPPWFAKKWLLHLLIAGVVAILIWVLYRAASQIEASE